MQGFIIEYNSDETQVALGMPTGLIEISSVNTEDGAPAEPISKVLAHKKEIVFLAFLAGEKIVSVDEKGGVAISDAGNGQTLNQMEIGGEYANASLSPSGNTLFLFTYGNDHDTKVFAIDIEKFHLTYGPKIRDLSTDSPVFPINDEVAAYYFLNEVKDESYDEDEKQLECLAYVNFDTGLVETKSFEGGPDSTFGDKPLFLLDASNNIGVRFAFNTPLEIVKDDSGKSWLAIQVEVFAADTLKTIRVIRVAGSPIEEDEQEELEELLAEKTIKDEDYREKQDDLYKVLKSGKLVNKGADLWIGLPDGALRRFKTDGSHTSQFIFHGGEPETSRNSLNDIFDRNIRNNQTLGVSPLGSYVGFSNPNDFFATTTIDIMGDKHTKLPMRAESQSGGAVEAPRLLKFIGEGKYIIICTGGGFVFLLDAAEQKVLHRLEIEYGDDLADASISPDGKELLLAYAGRDSLRVQLKAEGELEIEELPFPPHTIFSKYINETTAIFANSNGAVIQLEGDEISAFRNDEDLDDDEDDDYEDDEYEDDDDNEYEDDDDNEDDDEYEDDDDEDDDEDSPPEMKWVMKNHPDVEELEIMFNYEGGFIYNNFFEQKEPVYSTAHCLVEGQHYLATLLENGDIDFYKFGEDRIYFTYNYSTNRQKSIVASQDRLATFSKDSGKVELLTLSKEKASRDRVFEEKGLAMVQLSADAKTLYLFNEDSGRLSAINLSDYSETALLTYTGAGLLKITMDPHNRKMILTEGTGANIILDVNSGVAESSLEIKGDREERNIEYSTAPACAQKSDESINREYTDLNIQKNKDQKQQKSMEMFGGGARNSEDAKAEKDFEKQREKGLKLYKNESYSEAREFYLNILTEYQDQNYDSISGTDNFKNKIGNTFAILALCEQHLKNFEAAIQSFIKAGDYHYYKGYEDVAEIYAYELKDYQKALTVGERILTDVEIKNNIKLRKSANTYTAYIVAALGSGNMTLARSLLNDVFQNLVEFLEEHSQHKDILALREKLQAEAESEAPHKADAGELVTLFDKLKSEFKDPKKLQNEETQEILKATLGRIQFFAKNQRHEEVFPILNELLTPYEDSSFHSLKTGNPEKYNIGKAFALRAGEWVRQGNYQKAGKDYAKALDFRGKDCYPEAIETFIFQLKDQEEARNQLERVFQSPYYWASEYYAPFDRPISAYLYALRTLVLKSGASRLHEIYPDEIKNIIQRLKNQQSAPGGDVAKNFIAELEAAGGEK